ncbi:Gpi1-domain-containing protein [Serendipita vermifera]|nr:Gpi1-domain-containing protein [Serendipita vermifera]
MGTLRVFWPLEVNTTGTVIGWTHKDENSIVVATVVEDKVHKRSIENMLSRLGGYEKWQELQESCQRRPEVLGRVVLDRDQRVSIQFLEDTTNNDQFHFIFYYRPSLHHLQFFSVNPLQLDITTESHKGQHLTSKNAEYERQKVLFETFRPSTKMFDIRCATHQLNASGVVHDALTHGFPTHISIDPSGLFSLPQAVKSLGRALVITLSSIANLPISLFDNTNRLKDVSATVQQFDVRVEQFSFFPSQVRLIRTRSRRNVATFAAHYINFYNNIWLIFNDVVIGTTMGAVLCENHMYFGKLLHDYTQKWAIVYLKDALAWLDNWPVGLKLNTELSRALCLSFMVLTNIWGRTLAFMAPHLPTLIYVLGASGRLGVTMMLSLSSDTLSLLTVHIYISYLAATSVCHYILLTAGSLWNLFRGKRYNVLQNRLDSWDYSLDQLLLGTMLFTLVTFLSPTIIIYYGLFAAARLVIIGIHAVFETLLAFMNHFPLFVLMLRIKDPHRLPGGIVFMPRNSDQKSKNGLVLQNAPIPFSGIFFQHLLLWTRVSAHYNPVRLLRHVATATFINPIPRYSIRYSMLPRSGQPTDDKKTKVE